MDKRKIYDMLYQVQGYLLGGAIFLSLLSVAVRFDRHTIELVWRDRPHFALLVLIIGLLCMFLYIQVDKVKLRRLTQQIRQQETRSNADIEERLSLLTPRQLEVYQLIAAGNSNKEILSKLFIEASTLKTHINQLYKKLEIKSRRELRQLHAAERTGKDA